MTRQQRNIASSAATATAKRVNKRTERQPKSNLTEVSGNGIGRRRGAGVGFDEEGFDGAGYGVDCDDGERGS